MTLLIRRGVASLFLCTAALFLFINVEGKRLEKSISESVLLSPPASEIVHLHWSLNPEMIVLLQSVNLSLLPPPLADFGETFAMAWNAAATLFEATAENIRNLAVFITEQNGNIPMESALMQATAFWKYSIKYELPLDLAIAVAHTESHFNPRARSSAGAAGAMQVMWRIHAGLLQANGIMSEDDLYDPDLGIAAGSLLLSRYLRAHEDPQTALGRYYGGSASVYWRRVSRNLETIRKANIIEPSDI